ncbi:hypothetical protein BCL57_002083 [Agromyces flavus]|uniref:Uncharacterized protein n=1 Tax=Agromyces flavus TaxID=589382 RepID=A0ABT1KM12_9MICO|nr:hypothetical protein [Agromyces flavus]MCP2367924.1 hypothetical protein [Agromyces flavus]
MPDDNDPRGRHTVREWISLQAVDDVLSPLTSITSAELRDRYGARQAAPIESSQVDPSRVDRPRIDPRLTTAG